MFERWIYFWCGGISLLFSVVVFIYCLLSNDLKKNHHSFSTTAHINEREQNIF